MRCSIGCRHLEKKYRVQVDVVVSNWGTGIGVLISTQRMGSRSVRSGCYLDRATTGILAKPFNLMELAGGVRQLLMSAIRR